MSCNKECVTRCIASFKRKIATLSEEVSSLQLRNEVLNAEYAALQEQFDEYKHRHPETVGVKHGKPYGIESKVPPKSSDVSDASTSLDTHTEEPEKEKRRPGGQPGHKGYSRQKSNHITKNEVVDVTICPHCGNNELSDVQEKRTRIVEDVIVPLPDVIQFTINRRYCPFCKKLVEAPITAALPKARLGLRVMLIVVWLKVGERLTEEAIPKILHQLCGIKISKGAVPTICQRIAEEFGDYYVQLEDMIRNAPARYIDETSWFENGNKRWMWAFVTESIALYKIANGRGHEVPLEVLGEEPKGVDVHDRYRAYDKLATRTGNRPQQLCWFHILGDSKELAQLYGAEGKTLHAEMKAIFNRANALDHKGTQKDVEALCDRLRTRLEQKFTRLKCTKFARSLLKRLNQLFVFVTDPNVEGTNNRAERAIRPHVVYRKISGGTRSPIGTRTYEILASVIQTLRLQNKNFLIEGRDIIQTSHG